MKPASQLQVRLVAPDYAAPDAFVRFLFGREPTRPHDVRIPLPQLLGPERAEIWTCEGPHGFFESGGLQCFSSQDFCLVHASVPDDGGDLRSLTRTLYDDLVSTAVTAEFPHIVKAWNYIGGINEGSDDQERYRRFCLGRGEVYDACLAPEARAPAATAIGAEMGEPLTVLLMTSRLPVTTIENPRQLSAYRYPRRYGPRSPNFSRAALLRCAPSEKLFLSGTASIVGHESRHAGDVHAQLAETLTNVDSLLTHASGDGEAPALARGARLRAYVRREEDAEEVHGRLAPRLVDPADLVILRGEICRRELLVEIDGVVDGTAS